MLKNNIFGLVCVLIIFIIVLIYIKQLFLYQPIAACPDKYQKFYKKLLILTEENDSSHSLDCHSRNLTNVFVSTDDGALLDTVYLRNPDNDKCIIFFHGNAGNLAMRYDMIKFLYNFCSVIIFDYRFFGRSTCENGTLSNNGLLKDAYAVWNYTTHHFHPNNISFFGESLGCAIAVQLAANISKTMNSDLYPHSLILNSPFYSLESMINIMCDKFNIHFLNSVIALLLGSEYCSNEHIQFINHNTKIVIAHSPLDEIVPYKEGWQLYKSVGNHPHVKFVNITGTHNNLGLTDQYIYILAELFDDEKN